jgi:hypothetical protein
MYKSLAVVPTDFCILYPTPKNCPAPEGTLLEMLPTEDPLMENAADVPAELMLMFNT